MRYNGGMADGGGDAGAAVPLDPRPEPLPDRPHPTPPRRPARVAALRAHLRTAADRLRRRHRRLDHLGRAVERYRYDRIEYHALVVVSRGLFLTIATVMVLLYALSVVTHLLPGTNEIVIPTVSLTDSQDLGAVVDRVLEQFQSAVIGIVGLATLVISAASTARALRQGTRHVFDPDGERRVGVFAPSNLAIGLGLAGVVLASWLLALATAVRTAAVQAMIGGEVSRTLVPVGKAATVAFAFALITLVVFVVLRRSAADGRTRTVLLASAVFAAFLVGANFFLLYSYVGALIDPNSAGGIVLVLTILAWVNTVARALFLTECWVAEAL